MRQRRAGRRFPQVGIGLLGVALAFGLTVLTMAFALSHLSGWHLISITVMNTSVNHARSTGPALIVGGGAVQPLWLFWIAPLTGAALAGLT